MPCPSRSARRSRRPRRRAHPRRFPRRPWPRLRRLVLFGGVVLDGLVVLGLEVFEVQIRLLDIEDVAGLGLELVGGLELVVFGAGGLGGRRLRCGGLLGAAARGGASALALARGGPWSAGSWRPAVLAGLAAARLLAAGLSVFVVRGARLGGSLGGFGRRGPVGGLGRRGLLRGGLGSGALHRLCGCRACLCRCHVTLSVMRISMVWGMHHRKASAMSNVALISAGILAAFSVGGRRRPL